MQTRPLTRRSFLRSTLALGAAPLILRPGAWGQNAPSRQITLGFIGMGKHGHSLMGACLSRRELRVLAVCDVDSTRRNHAKSVVEKRYANLHPSGACAGCSAYGDFRELLARSDVDAVVIATPDHWHAPVTIAAANAGKDIYCEKPLSHGVAEGRRMVQAIRNNQRVLQVGSMQRSAREFRDACELVRNGVLGDIERAEFAIGGSAGGGPPRACNLPGEPLEPGLDWDLWLGPAPERDFNSVLSPRGMHQHYPAWRQYWEYGGGGVGDWGSHHLDIIHWAFDLDSSGPVEILPAERPDAVSGVRLRYRNGLEVTHRVTNERGQSRPSGATFHGSKGRLFVGRRDFRLWFGDELQTDDVLEARMLTQELLPADAIRLYASDDHIGDWVQSMRTRQKPICDVETGHRTASACHLVNMAYRYRQRLEWDPEKETFAGGTGNPDWLVGQHRGPWHA